MALTLFPQTNLSQSKRIDVSDSLSFMTYGVISQTQPITADNVVCHSSTHTDYWDTFYVDLFAIIEKCAICSFCQSCYSNPTLLPKLILWRANEQIILRRGVRIRIIPLSPTPRSPTSRAPHLRGADQWWGVVSTISTVSTWGQGLHWTWPQLRPGSADR